jgi:hypothetical protein
MPAEIGQTDSMSPTASSSSHHDVVDEPLLRTIVAEIQEAIPGAEPGWRPIRVLRKREISGANAPMWPR